MLYPLYTNRSYVSSSIWPEKGQTRVETFIKLRGLGRPIYGLVEDENSILPYWLSNASALLCLLQRNIRSNGFLSASSKRSAGSTGLNGRIAQARPLLTRALEEGNFDGLVDSRLRNNYNQSEMSRMVACATACVRHSARRRPRMSQATWQKMMKMGQFIRSMKMGPFIRSIWAEFQKLLSFGLSTFTVVKDMMDFESAHMSYLNDSLTICFLSDETTGIASIIQNILQCALDFRSCLTGSTWQTGVEIGDSSSNFSQTNISQVHNIRRVFYNNLKELYICYLKSPKHGEFSLSRFWDCLNYNDYYAEVIG
ncbi:hypothetical protein POM88_047317 [Heracleum sosnowskyi]|uniref:Gamma-tubulin complex component n=1 Tax=Heracleum sosnowskyi TaxID=360622 RepID=A0AAD8LYL3_9APIA|nr:hypothetical protein POM88_047317 [Heracleum sosnowskyi]